MENQGGFLFTLKILLEALLNMLCVYNMKKKNSVQRKEKEKKKRKIREKNNFLSFYHHFLFPTRSKILTYFTECQKIIKIEKDFRFIDFLTLIRYKVICL